MVLRVWKNVEKVRASIEKWGVPAELMVSTGVGRCISDEKVATRVKFGFSSFRLESNPNMPESFFFLCFCFLDACNLLAKVVAPMFMVFMCYANCVDSKCVRLRVL